MPRTSRWSTLAAGCLLAVLWQPSAACAQFFPAGPPAQQFPKWRIELPFTRPVYNWLGSMNGVGYGGGGGGGGAWVRGKPLLPMASPNSPIHYWSHDQLMQGEAVKQADQAERNRQAQLLRRQEEARLQQVLKQLQEKQAQERESRRQDVLAQQRHQRALEDLAKQRELFSPAPVATFDPATAPPPNSQPVKPKNAVDDAERRAAAKLKMGQQLVAQGQPRDGQDYFESVVAMYPHTKAAEQARAVLAKPKN